MFLPRVKILVKDQPIVVQGGEVPFFLKKIDEAEFTKRKNAVPADPIGG